MAVCIQHQNLPEYVKAFIENADITSCETEVRDSGDVSVTIIYRGKPGMLTKQPKQAKSHAHELMQEVTQLRKRLDLAEAAQATCDKTGDKDYTPYCVVCDEMNEIATTALAHLAFALGQLSALDGNKQFHKQFTSKELAEQLADDKDFCEALMAINPQFLRKARANAAAWVAYYFSYGGNGSYDSRLCGGAGTTLGEAIKMLEREYGVKLQREEYQNERKNQLP